MMKKLFALSVLSLALISSFAQTNFLENYSTLKENAFVKDDTVFSLNLSILQQLPRCTEDELKAQSAEKGCEHTIYFDCGMSVQFVLIPKNENDLPFPVIFGIRERPSTLTMYPHPDTKVEFDTILNYLIGKYGSPDKHQTTDFLEVYEFYRDGLHITLEYHLDGAIKQDFSVHFTLL